MRFPHSMPISAIDINILTFYRYGNNKKKKKKRMEEKQRELEEIHEMRMSGMTMEEIFA